MTIFTHAAAQKVKSLLDEVGDPLLKFRAYVCGGGCSGFRYEFTFDKEIQEGDVVIEPSGEPDTGVQLFIDLFSYQYLAQAEIDYSEGIKGAQFVIRNPTAKSTCGCGESFSV